MEQHGWRSVVGVLAAVWFLVASMSLGAYSDQVAQALVELGRAILIGLALLSLVLLDLDWLVAQARRLARSAAQPTT